MRRKRNRYHDDLMDGYYSAREAQERDAEAYAIGYATELAEYYQNNQRVTFKMWLQHQAKELAYHG